MIDLDTVITKVSKQLDIDREIVNVVCRHPFLFTIDIMKDESDAHDILFNRLFRFTLKGRFKQNKNKPYSPKV